jgi:hypothetical protein
VPLAHILLPGHQQTFDGAAGERLPCFVDGAIVLRVPGREERAAGRGRAPLEIDEFAHGGRRRLLQEHVLARLKGGAGDLVARLRRRADGHGVEIGQAQHLLPIRERVRDSLDCDSALARHRHELEGGVSLNDRQVLVLGDLAEADHPKLVRPHGRSPSAARLFRAACSGRRTLELLGSFPFQ